MRVALFLLWQQTSVSLAQTMSNALWERTLLLSDAQGPRLMSALPSCGCRASLSQCQGKREIQCLSLCLGLELTHHFYLQPIRQTGPMTLSNCQGTGKFGEALNTQRAVDVSTTQSLSSLVFFKLCLVDPWALKRCITSSVDNDVQSTKC